MIARSIKDLEAIWTQLDRSKWLTDKIIGFGPFGIGLNGMAALVTSAAGPLGIPAFEFLTLIIALYLLTQAVRARASPGAILAVLLVLILDACFDLLDFVPFLGGMIDAVFRGPLLAAKIIQKDIERTHWIESSAAEARASGAMERHFEEMRAQKKRRVVYLGEQGAGYRAVSSSTSAGSGSRR
jgi:hypothetical protein